GPDPADLERPSARSAEGALVIAQAELGLRDAHRETVEACVLEALEVVQGRGVVLHVVGAIDRRGDLRDLLLQGILILVGEADATGRCAGRFQDEPREFFAARAAVRVAGVRRRADAEVPATVRRRVRLPTRA